MHSLHSLMPLLLLAVGDKCDEPSAIDEDAERNGHEEPWNPRAEEWGRDGVKVCCNWLIEHGNDQ